jgi:hypothetical protein
MDPITLIRDPSQRGAVEFLPGEFKGQFWNAASVYLEEGTFVLISNPIARHVPDVRYFGNAVVQRPVWEKIIADLEALAIRVSQAANLRELDGTLGFLRSLVVDPDEDSDEEKEFQKDFPANAKALVVVINELVAWLRETLKTYDSISILGV